MEQEKWGWVSQSADNIVTLEWCGAMNNLSFRYLGESAKKYLKKTWKALPIAVRELPLKYLCMLLLGNRQYVRPQADTPVYILGNIHSVCGK